MFRFNVAFGTWNLTLPLAVSFNHTNPTKHLLQFTANKQPFLTFHCWLQLLSSFSTQPTSNTALLLWEASLSMWLIGLSVQAFIDWVSTATPQWQRKDESKQGEGEKTLGRFLERLNPPFSFCDPRSVSFALSLRYASFSCNNCDAIFAIFLLLHFFSFEQY